VFGQNKAAKVFSHASVKAMRERDTRAIARIICMRASGRRIARLNQRAEEYQAANKVFRRGGWLWRLVAGTDQQRYSGNQHDGGDIKEVRTGLSVLAVRPPGVNKTRVKG
jgi:hypothetical protein